MSSVSDWIGEHWEKVKQGFAGLSRGNSPFILDDLSKIHRDVVAMGFSGSDDEHKDLAFGGWVTALEHYGQQQLGHAGNVLSPVLDFPGVKQTGMGITWVQKTALNRPIATAALAADSADRSSDPFSTFTSFDNWRQAWNTSRQVTAGQALTYNAAQLIGAVDAADRRYDPRQSKDAYYSDWFFQSMSGGIDFLLVLPDPFKGIGKLSRIGKARFVDQAVTSAEKIGEGQLEKHMFGSHAEVGQSLEETGGALLPRNRKLYDRYRTIPEPVARRLYFNQEAYGGVVSTGLSAAAKAGDESAFADVLLAAQGSIPATQRLFNKPGGSAFAEALARSRDPFNTVNTVVKSADDEFAQAKAAAMEDSHRTAWIDQIARGSADEVDAMPGFGTMANVSSSMFGKGTPRVSPLLDAMKDGLHSFGSGSYTPVQVGPWNAKWAMAKGVQGLRHAARIADRTRGYESHIDVNYVGSHRGFRANLERAGDFIGSKTRDEYVTAYGAALTANERARIAGIADNHIVGVIANRYGMTVAEVKRLQNEATFRRQNFRRLLNSQQKFLPTEFRKRADELLAAGAQAEAAQVQKLADDYNALVTAQKVPQSVYFTVDERARLNILPIVDENEPLLTSHVADRLPMTDYQNFSRTLDRFAKPRRDIEKYESDLARVENGEDPIHGISEAAYKKAKQKKVVNDVRSVADDVYQAFNYVWSVAAVLRPAQTLRSLGDDGSRSLMLLGMLPTLVNGSQGLSRIGQRVGKYGMTRMQESQLARSVRSTFGKSHHTINVADNPTPPSYLEPTSESSGYYNYTDPDVEMAPVQIGDSRHYDSLEGALLDGQIHLDTYVRYVAWAARQGRVPHDLEALIDDVALGLDNRRGRDFYPDVATFMLDRAGKLSDYRSASVREIALHALTRGGRAAFASPRWQHDLAESINSMSDGTRGRAGVVANPFTADAQVLKDGVASRDYEFVDHKYLTPNPRTNALDDYDGIYDYVASHLPRLLTGHHKLHAKWASDGRVRLSVVREKKMPHTPAQRMNAHEKEAQLKGLKMRGSNGLRMVSGHGEVVIPGSLAGTQGGYARSAVSAARVPYSLQQANRNVERAQQWNNNVSRDDILPFKTDVEGVRITNPDYDPAWEKYANLHLANDEVSRMFLQGRSEAHVLDWLDSSDPNAMRYLNDRAKTGLTIDQHVSVARGLVDHVVPPAAGQALRDKVLRQEATAADLRGSLPEDLLPSVNGEVVETSLRTHPVVKWATKRLDGWFRKMQDLPADYLIRLPFYDTRYKSYFHPMYDNYIRNRAGVSVSQDEINRLGRIASQRAIDDVKTYLYDSAYRTDLADALSSFMPFSNAIADSLFKWTKIIRERPLEALANWNLIYNAPERMGLVYDQDGNKLKIDENGREVWHSAIDDSILDDDIEHDRYVAFQVPSWLKPLTGGLTLASFNKTSMTTAIFDPSVQAGPLIAYPVNHFALSHPQFGDNKFIKSFVLPYGPSSEETETLLPGLLRSAHKFLSDDSSLASSSVMAIYQTQLTDIRTGKRTGRPNLDEAKQQAWLEKGLRFMSSAFAPVSFKYQTPYQPYVDAYSQLLRKHSGDGDAAMGEFRERFGDEYVYLAARVTKSNIALPSTMEGYNAFKAKQDTIAQFPNLAGLITGADGAGSFSKSVYEWEKRQTYDETGKPIREPFRISDSIAEVQKKTGWQDYMKQNALVQNDLWRRGLTSMNDPGAEDIKQAYADWLRSKMFVEGPNQELDINPWWDDFRSTDGATMTKRLSDMQQILTMHPKWLKGRDDLQGLATHLEQRDQIKKAMQFYGYASLDSQKAAWLQGVWQSQIFDLKQRNPAFGQLYDRWLTRDNLSAEGITANEIVTAFGGSNV